jgi:hypothetical protein
MLIETIEVSLLNFPPSDVQIIVHYKMYKNNEGRTAKYGGVKM